MEAVEDEAEEVADREVDKGVVMVEQLLIMTQLQWPNMHRYHMKNINTSLTTNKKLASLPFNQSIIKKTIL